MCDLARSRWDDGRGFSFAWKAESMKAFTLTLSTLHQLSPELADDFAQQIEAATADCRQRPSLAKKREVSIKLTIIPHPEDPDDVLIAPITTRKTPARHIQPIRARRTPKNQLQFDFTEEE
jgi:hypothetical protein